MAEISRISRAFKDISLSFQAHPVTGDLPVIKNERAINKSVRNIVETIPGEKFYAPDFGSDVRGSLFELVDYADAAAIRDQITFALENYEPRIDNLEVEVNPLAESNELEVLISYEIIGQDFPTQEYSFILEATR